MGLLLTVGEKQPSFRRKIQSTRCAYFFFFLSPMPGHFGQILWTLCYMAVLLGFAAYGIHRWWIIYLFLKNRRRVPQPLAHFEQLPVVTVQLPIFNERYVAERLLARGQRAGLPARTAGSPGA